jgi:hypothetical protein
VSSLVHAGFLYKKTGYSEDSLPNLCVNNIPNPLLELIFGDPLEFVAPPIIREISAAFFEKFSTALDDLL